MNRFVLHLVMVLASLFVSVAARGSERGVEVEARGPLHEAYAQPWEKDAVANEPIEQKPPQPIPEEPPDDKPPGENVQWIPGYWHWDDEKKDFIWISGFWRDVPTGRRWIAGYWAETPQGYRWISGHWAAEAERDYQFVPPPPSNLDEGPSTPAPDADSFYIPGTWFYSETGYRWRPGYWAGCRPGFLWTPARYVWTPFGYIFASGFWDLAFPSRGLLFAPIYFTSRLWLTPGWVYRPSWAISVGAAFNSFFVRQGYSHYYFGDYFGPNYARFGIQPWCAFGVRQYDPIFAYERWNNRANAQWLSSMQRSYQARASGAQPPPPRTLVDQIKPTAGAKSTPLVSSLDQLRQSGQRLEKVTPQQRNAQIQNARHIVSRSVEQTRGSMGNLSSTPPISTRPTSRPTTTVPAARPGGTSGGSAPVVTDRGKPALNAPPGTARPVASPPSTPRTIVTSPRTPSVPGSITPPVTGTRPSTPNIPSAGSVPRSFSPPPATNRPSMPSIGGGSGRPTMPSIGGGSGRPTMPSIGGGGRPGGKR